MASDLRVDLRFPKPLTHKYVYIEIPTPFSKPYDELIDPYSASKYPQSRIHESHFPPHLFYNQFNTGYTPGFQYSISSKDCLLREIEKYFSDENLRHDSHLKIKVNSFGWVDISEISRDKRIISQSARIGLIKEAVASSDIVELRDNKLQRKGDWHRWNLTTEKSNASQQVRSRL